MGQCICTLCTPPLCCVGALVATCAKDRALVASGGLTLVGIAAFVVLSIQCGGIDLVGGNGNPCWSEGDSKATGLGLMAALGLGLGGPITAYSLIRRARSRDIPNQPNQPNPTPSIDPPV